MSSASGIDLPDDFAALPAEEQRRLLDAGLLMTQMAFRHAAAIIVSAPPSADGKTTNGSGFVVELNNKRYLGTAWHVVESWLERTATGEDVLFQVRDAVLDPSKSIAWKDEKSDIVFLELTAEEARQIDISVCEPVRGWPPSHPRAGEYVLISGFPAVIREHPSTDRIDFHALSTLLQITTVGERHFVCQFERQHWIAYNIRGFPPPGTDLGGMSGGPVFSVGNLVYPLVGLVSEFSSNFELLYIKSLSHVPVEL